MAIKVNNDTVIFDDRTLKVSSGTERPANPEVGTLWYNESNGLEVYDGAEWRSITEPLPADPDIIALSWGSGNSGRLGTNDTIDRSSPVIVAGGITDWTQIATGFGHNLALRSNGVLYAWGINGSGRLGTNDTIDRLSPVTVVGGITDWTQISGSSHSLALRSNGVLYAWGVGSFGRLGDNTTINRSSPVTVVGGITDWTQISGGGSHSLALRSNGVLYAWGSGNSGRLGDNTTINRSSPVIVAGGITNWEQISAGGFFSLALRSNGVLYAWGYNGSGRLGINVSTIAISSPVIVAGGITDWTQISGGSAHNLALRSNGVLYAWGNGSFGRLGTNDLIARSSPVIVAGGITDWTQISTSSNAAHNLALRSNGVLYAWGQSGSGRLGTNNTIDRSSPVIVVGGITDWTQIAAGSDHNLALRVAE